MTRSYRIRDCILSYLEFSPTVMVQNLVSLGHCRSKTWANLNQLKSEGLIYIQAWQRNDFGPPSPIWAKGSLEDAPRLVSKRIRVRRSPEERDAALKRQAEIRASIKEGLPAKEVAKKTGVSQNNVYHHARTQNLHYRKSLRYDESGNRVGATELDILVSFAFPPSQPLVQPETFDVECSHA